MKDARDPSIPPEELRKLARIEDPFIQENVAANPSTPTDVLEELSRNTSVYVRSALAANPSTPAYILEQVSTSPNTWERLAVAANPSTPPAALNALLGDPEIEIVLRAAENPATPDDGKPRALARINANTFHKTRGLVNRMVALGIILVITGSISVIGAIVALVAFPNASAVAGLINGVITFAIGAYLASVAGAGNPPSR